MFEPLRRYAEMNAALCPIPAGQKAPGGIIQSFAHDWSKDPKQWLEWSRAHPDCNWIMVAGPSQKIIVDIDVKKVGREAAWTAWGEWCTAHELPVYQPQVITPSQGWHIYFETTESNLHQPALVRDIIDVRAGNGFVLIPPSHINGVNYAWLT